MNRVDHALGGVGVARGRVPSRRVLAAGGLLLAYVVIGIVNQAYPIGDTDELSYLFYADQLTHGGYAVSNPLMPDQFLWHGPGLPLILAPFVALDVPVELTRMIGPLSLFGAALVLRQTLRMSVSPRAATIGTAAFVLFYPLWSVIGDIYSEPPAALCVSVALYCWVRYRASGEERFAWYSGLALGYLALVRSEYGYVLLLGVIVSALAWAMLRRRACRTALVTSLIALVVCSPWLAYTYSKTHEVFYWSNSGSLNLYSMATGKSRYLGDTFGGVFEKPYLAEFRPLFGHLRTLPPEKQDSELRHMAIENIKHDPVLYARNVGYNVSRLAFNFPWTAKEQSIRPLYYVVGDGILILALWIGLIWIAVSRRWRIVGVAPIFLGFATLAVHLPVGGQPRFWMPVVPIFVWFATVSLTDLSASVSSSGASEPRLVSD
jgi:4-amino-4-deoxy-L-arabinose transferase-like glycosyltransferase